MALPQENLLLSGEAARILECSVPLVQYLERIGRLRATRIGRLRVFVRGDVERLAAKRKKERARRSQACIG